MMFLPYERLTIHTYLSPEQARQKLVEVVEPRKWFRFYGTHKPYQGEINGNHFNISRIIHYRNSFLPVITGDIQPDLGGSSIIIVMRPHIVVIIFMVVWLSGAGMGVLVTLFGLIMALLGPEPVGPMSGVAVLFPLAFFGFGYTLFVGGFKFESIKSKAFFRQLFKGR